MSFYKEGIEKTPIVGDIKILEKITECEDEFSFPILSSRDYQAIKNIIKAYKEKEIETKKDKETIAKLSYELGKYQEKSKEYEAVIEEMAKYIKEPYFLNIFGSRKPKIEIIKEYFKNKVKEKK